MRRKKTNVVEMTEVEADFVAVVYRINRTPHARRVLDLLTHEPTRGTHMELNAIVGRYRFAATFGPHGLTYVPAPGTDREDCNAVRLLLSLDPKRIKRCAWCRDWFYAASRLDQRFCKSGNCRQDFHQRDPVKYAAKLKRMKDRYRADQEQDRNAKNRVGFRGRPKSKPST